MPPETQTAVETKTAEAHGPGSPGKPRVTIVPTAEPPAPAPSKERGKAPISLFRILGAISFCAVIVLSIVRHQEQSIFYDLTDGIAKIHRMPVIPDAIHQKRQAAAGLLPPVSK